MHTHLQLHHRRLPLRGLFLRPMVNLDLQLYMALADPLTVIITSKPQMWHIDNLPYLKGFKRLHLATTFPAMT